MGFIQVLGLCRFSFPATLDSFQTRHTTMEERRAYLYSTDRLELRCHWFEHMALPALKAQTDKRFTLLLLFGDDFPEPYRSRMLDMIRDVKQIVPVFRPSQPHRDLYRELMTDARYPNARVVAEFRLDDDDAVAVDFVAQTRLQFHRVSKLTENSDRIAVDFSKGVAVLAEKEGQVAYTPVIAPNWAPGMVIYLPPNDERSVMDFPHYKIARRMPVVSLQHKMMFLRGAHWTNDSPIKINRLEFDFEMTQMKQTLSERFAFNTASFEAGLKAL
ncbi:glycosyltransferase [Cochlodiniinecator piscidefendens]|uniref:glycosyltransferase n=1 Tax=Cochlodiniinecator piscidefendens TaxID=2715756 RepID=UPI00140D5CAD|nr:glycosyltransferase [Cochlodiniinecator piscidefendens]